MQNKKLPIGIQDFREIIENGYLYVDKTREIYPLLEGNGKYFFFSRPRRFGKSLLVSILKEIFQGQRQLFKGLWIEDKLNWKTYCHPVIHIDFTQLNFEQPALLKSGLQDQLRQCARHFNIDQTGINDYKSGFGYLISQLAKIDKVVVLIDEYDKPMIDFIDKPAMALENRDILRNFYVTLKAFDAELRFVFLTGVSKFSKVSVFSGLNNLRDISISDEFSALLGYTQEQLELFFSSQIEAAAIKTKLPKNELLTEIRSWYNGYSWDGQNFVYNPFSILSFFVENRFQNYWFSSGTPTFLMKLIEEKQLPVAEFESLIVNDYVLENFDIESLELESLLFQTGYLTIKRRFEKDGNSRYELSYPNREVGQSFTGFLLQFLSRQPFSRITNSADQLTDYLKQGNLPEFFKEIKSIFASIPYDLSKKQNEGYYHSLFYLILKLLGTSISCEIETNRGRIDAILHTADHTYILEFKMGKASSALAQIKKTGYAESFAGNQKKVILIGVGFDQKQRNIDTWKAIASQSEN
jgi:hypothetical protein